LLIAALRNSEGLDPHFEKKVAEKVVKHFHHQQELETGHKMMGLKGLVDSATIQTMVTVVAAYWWHCYQRLRDVVVVPC